MRRDGNKDGDKDGDENNTFRHFEQTGASRVRNVNPPPPPPPPPIPSFCPVVGHWSQKVSVYLGSIPYDQEGVVFCCGAGRTGWRECKVHAVRCAGRTSHRGVESALRLPSQLFADLTVSLLLNPLADCRAEGMLRIARSLLLQRHPTLFGCSKLLGVNFRADDSFSVRADDADPNHHRLFEGQ